MKRMLRYVVAFLGTLLLIACFWPIAVFGEPRVHDNEWQKMLDDLWSWAKQ